MAIADQWFTIIPAAPPVNMMKVTRPAYLLLLLLILAYIILFAPENSPENLSLIQRMYSPGFRTVNPLVFTVFNLMGVWPMVYAVLVLDEAEAQGFTVLPFIVLSFFMGGFIYLIYFSLRTPSLVQLPKTRLQKKLVKKSNMVLLFLAGAALILYGVLYGDWIDYAAVYGTNSLIHVMTIDFVLVSLLFPILLRDDLRRRGKYSSRNLLLYSIGSIFGALVYLIKRQEKRTHST
jgi:hypothetical protein